MLFTETALKDSFLIKPEKINDERGYFTRIFDKNEFKKRGLVSDFVQDSISFNRIKGTIRGMHFQLCPFEEAKIVTCIKGKIFDVVIDLRSSSKTFKHWFNFELDAEIGNMIYIPKGIAHGFQTLEDNTTVSYKMSEYFNPNLYRGLRWNDPFFNIKWPLKPTMISKKDLSFPDFTL